MGLKRADEFRADAVWIALTSGLTHKQVADDCPSSGFLAPRAAYTKREFGSSGCCDYAARWR